MKTINPLTCLDYPDPDVIRVDDIYYMVSTTMHFFPGCEILKSYDLVNWEHVTYVYDVLDSTPAQRLEAGQNIYGKGMWAASFRYHKGVFYICFVANDTHKTYLYTSDTIEGPWKKQYIEGFYHDCSLLFDDDGRVYIAYGNRDIYITELDENLSGPKKGGYHRLVVSDKDNPLLGYEGTHFYKINGKYYLMFVHSLSTRWRRTEAVFVADSLEGEFIGKDVFNDDAGYLDSGIAQGAIVDTPDGKWYAILFQDMGAVGRVPYLLPVTWKNDFPIFGNEGKMPENFVLPKEKQGYKYAPLVGDDDFKDSNGLKKYWQFNHEPDYKNIIHDPKQGLLQLSTSVVSEKMVQTPNILTQRMRYPTCEAEVTVDVSGIKNGDIAGLCALQGSYAYVAVKREDDAFYLIMASEEKKDQESTFCNWEKIYITDTNARLKIKADFSNGKDEALFYYSCKGSWRRIGITKKLRFMLDHFCGCRFGLFYQATQETGGIVAFSKFTYT